MKIKSGIEKLYSLEILLTLGCFSALTSPASAKANEVRIFPVDYIGKNFVFPKIWQASGLVHFDKCEVYPENDDDIREGKVLNTDCRPIAGSAYELANVTTAFSAFGDQSLGSSWGHAIASGVETAGSAYATVSAAFVTIASGAVSFGAGTVFTGALTLAAAAETYNVGEDALEELRERKLPQGLLSEIVTELRSGQHPVTSVFLETEEFNREPVVEMSNPLGPCPDSNMMVDSIGLLIKKSGIKSVDVPVLNSIREN